jgi:hypothetical protein
VATTIASALINTSAKFEDFAQTPIGQYFVAELDQAVEAAEQAAVKAAELDDPRYEAIMTYAAAQQAAEARLANLLTVAQLVAAGLA